MNVIQKFTHEAFGEIRSMKMNDGSVWFVGKEIATALGYKNATKAVITHVREDDRGMSKMGTPSGIQQTYIINESGLYSLILSSKLPQAQQFKHWVTSVVLPQIRKTGGYIPVTKEDDDATILAKALMICQRTLEQKDKLLAEQKPMVQFANAITASDDSILIGDLAKLLTQNGIEVGRTRLFTWFRKNGYIFQHENRPIQKWVEKGLFEVHETLIETHHGDKISVTTKVTGKGQKYFIDGFVNGSLTL